jgi:hypothetical protein
MEQAEAEVVMTVTEYRERMAAAAARAAEGVFPSCQPKQALFRRLLLRQLDGDFLRSVGGTTDGVHVRLPRAGVENALGCVSRNLEAAVAAATFPRAGSQGA